MEQGCKKRQELSRIPLNFEDSNTGTSNQDSKRNKALEHSVFEVLQTKGMKISMLFFMFYSGIEAGIGLSGGSYLTLVHGLQPARAALWISFYYASITFGRFASGILSMHLSNSTLVRIGQALVLLGVILLYLPTGINISSLALILIGAGCAPIIPSMMHETPKFFGHKYAPTAVGLQMSSIFVGIMLLPPLFGQIANFLSISFFPNYLFICLSVVVILSETLRKKCC